MRLKVKGRPKRTWKNQVQEESTKVGLSWEDVLCQSKQIVSIYLIATKLRLPRPSPLVGDTTTS